MVEIEVVVVLSSCYWMLLTVLVLVLSVRVATSWLVLPFVAVLVGTRSWMLMWVPVLVLVSLVAAVLSVAGRQRSWCFLAWARPSTISPVRCAAFVVCGSSVLLLLLVQVHIGRLAVQVGACLVPFGGRCRVASSFVSALVALLRVLLRLAVGVCW